VFNTKSTLYRAISNADILLLFSSIYFLLYQQIFLTNSHRYGPWPVRQWFCQ